MSRMKADVLLMQFAFTCSKRWTLARALPQPMEGFPNFEGFWRSLPFQNKGWDVYLTLIQVWVILKDYIERTSKEYIHFYCYLCQSIELKKLKFPQSLQSSLDSRDCGMRKLRVFIEWKNSRNVWIWSRVNIRILSVTCFVKCFHWRK